MTHGLIVGRFMPPHAGHQLLIETALELVDALTVLVCHLPGDPIPGGARLGWMRALFPTARVLLHEARLPAAAEAHRDSDHAWCAGVRAANPDAFDFLFGADDRILPLARAIGARPVLLDPAREALPASAAEIRADPMAHWRSLPDIVRPFYARTICLHGPESTGKSTLGRLLARHYETILVPEYGRTYCEQFGVDLTMADLVAIARGHAAMTHAALRRCNRRLILDTDPLMTAAWADMLFGHQDPWFATFCKTADLYLLLDADLPWVDDGTRFFGREAERRRFFDLSRAELERRGCRYAIIGGPHQSRLERAVEAIEAAGL